MCCGITPSVLSCYAECVVMLHCVLWCYTECVVMLHQVCCRVTLSVL